MTGTLTVPLADDLATEICKVLNLDVATVARMIIDLQAGMPVKVYIDSFADKAIEDIDWARFLTGAEVKSPTKEERLNELARRDAQWERWTRLIDWSGFPDV